MDNLTNKKVNCETMFTNFKIASKNWIDNLNNQLEKIDKEKEPIAYDFIETQLDNAKTMHFTLTGTKSKQLKELLCQNN